MVKLETAANKVDGYILINMRIRVYFVFAFVDLLYWASSNPSYSCSVIMVNVRLKRCSQLDSYCSQNYKTAFRLFIKRGRNVRIKLLTSLSFVANS